MKFLMQEIKDFLCEQHYDWAYLAHAPDEDIIMELKIKYTEKYNQLMEERRGYNE